ncbi:MAG: nucleotide sugar dehydrogenase [Candidatus Gorgyraea atricola]|nr:nucleotide sugar dehydrogenase [Candidatus Gorgyraea atricola]
MKKKKTLSIFGLGYVGVVTAACLAEQGYHIIGVDVSRKKLDLINKGKSPIVEKGIDDLVSKTVKRKRFCVTDSAMYAISNSEVSIVCVGTPSMENGAIDLSHLKNVSREIGASLKGLRRYHIIVIRSTMMPGTTEDVVIPIIEKASSKKAFKDFGVLVNPEFMREGNSIEDFYAPAKVIIGSRKKQDEKVLRSIYGFIKAPFISTDFKTAEFSKYLDNVFHGLKIVFANEIGAFSKRFGLDGKKAMEILCMDKKSNISGMYLKPGFAFGGSCLPKDLKAVLHKTKIGELDLPLLGSIVKSNDLAIRRAFEAIKKTGKKKITMLGLSFKPGTDDLRESQMVRLAELLIGKGYKLKIYDKNVSLAALMGANRTYIENEIPHIASLLCGSINEAIKTSEVIVVGHSAKEFKKAIKKIKKNQVLIDLT